MEYRKNAVGRLIPKEVEGRKLVPFKGAFAYRKKGRKASPPISYSEPGEKKLCKSLKDAIRAAGLKDGMTISFHHHLRNGDGVVNMVLDTIAEMGIRGLTLAPSALFPVHAPVIEHIKNGVIRNIQGSMNGPVGEFVSYGGLPTTAILRSHGGRVRAIEDGTLHIDVAFIAASSADDHGNLNGVYGKSQFGPLAYAMADAMYADKSIAITDTLLPYPNLPISIPAVYVDYIVVVDSIGDPSGIVSGTTRITRSPTRLLIAKYAAQFIKESGLLKDGFSFQTGAGGISLAITKFLGEMMEREGIKGSFINGGITRFAVELFHKGIVHSLFDGQVFDTESVDSFRDDTRHAETSMSQYANIHSKGCLVNKQDVGFLGATEVDINFNVNVNTHSDGLLLHGIGGHQDVAAGAKLSMIVVPSFRNRIPVIKESVTTVTTPGETIDVVVTERGIAINPRREDLIERMKGSSLPIKPIEELKDEVEKTCGKPAPPKLKDRIIALIEYRDGTYIDVVREVER